MSNVAHGLRFARVFVSCLWQCVVPALFKRKVKPTPMDLNYQEFWIVRKRVAYSCDRDRPFWSIVTGCVA